MRRFLIVFSPLAAMGMLGYSVWLLRQPPSPIAMPPIRLLAGRVGSFVTYSEDWNTHAIGGFFELDMTPEQAYKDAREDLVSQGWKEKPAVALHRGTGAARKIVGYSHGFERRNGKEDMYFFIEPSFGRKDMNKADAHITVFTYSVRPFWNPLLKESNLAP